MSLRTHLALLIVIAVLPVTLFSAWIAYVLVEHERDTFRRGAEARVLTLMTAVDSELDSSMTTANALAAMPALADGNLADFQRTAASVLGTQPDWLRIRLISRDGETLVNVAAPGTDASPPRNLLDAMEPVVKSGKPVVGNVALDRRLQRWGFRILSPVVQDGAVKYVVSVFVSVDAIRDIIAAQRLPDESVTLVVDGGNRIVARNRDMDRYVGKTAPDDLREALKRTPSGAVAETGAEGREQYSPYWRSAKTGWAVSMGYPVAVVEGGAQRAALIIGAGLLVSLAIATVVASYIARNVSAPIASLAAASDALAHGQRPGIVDESDIVEIRKLTNALRAASRAIGERQALIEREKAALEENEKRFRAMADGAPVMIWMSGPDKLCTWFNKPWLDFTGRALEQELGNGWTDGVHPEDLERCVVTYADASDRRAPFEMEYRLRRRDGEYRWILDQGVPRDDAGAFAGYIGSCVDIHERRRAEDALVAADRHKDEFLAAISHELRNPLAALTAAAHILKAAPVGHEASIEAARIVGRQTRNMSRLIEDLLDISRIVTGKMALERKDVDLAAVAQEVVSSWQKSGRAENVSVSTGLAPVWVRGDRARLEQVVANLLDNALKFTSVRRRIDLSVRREEDKAVLEVADEGQGMSPELLERAFGLFEQGPDDPAHSHGGLGIGLALVRHIAELHGGSASAASDGSGMGSTFRMVLPAIEPPAAIREQATQAAPAASVTPRRILVIEHNDDVRAMVRAALSLGGHRVSEARDAATGLAAATAIRPDVAIVDLGLHDLDGYELARRLRTMYGDRVRLVALSGFGQPHDVQLALEAGFDTHLTKPASAEQLNEVLAKLGETRVSA